ncbi:MAG TPA: methyltransferase [Actinocrinis sp.]|uniref:methyltransferase n=1 Tax=Actinocrinis sp. TaxID=1920516 RepID=UPI002DDCBA53|nr:methyltransferase [Actinocrinis sp.]HEV2346644.1 methyltransferase [Actinocrinis sp.]
MTPEATLARFREYMVGPTRFMNLLSCFELGIIDALRADPGMTAARIGEAVGVSPGSVEQLLILPVKEGFVTYDEDSGAYSLGAIADVPEADLKRALAFMNMIKVVLLRQMFYLSESARAGSVVGLKEVYGFDGNLFGAVGALKDVRDAWMGLAEVMTASVYPWFFGNVRLPTGARVLDVLGGNGLGAVMTQRLTASAQLRVTTFDRPEFEEECLRSFRDAGVSDRCSFVGGDVLEGMPAGFDVVMVKHFLDIFDKDEVLRIFRNANRSLEDGGELVILVAVYPEDLADPTDYQADFFPAFILGGTIGRGGAQKVSTYRGWLKECGFEVTSVIDDDPSGLTPDAVLRRAILRATKTATA